MSGPVLGLLLVIGMILLYFGTYVLNKSVDAPAGIAPVSKCSTCGSGSCSIREEAFSSKEEIEECELYETN